MRRVNTLPKARSLSRTIYVGARSQGNASVIWCANHSAVGCRVTANHNSCRRPWTKNKKCEELLKGNRRNDKEINRRDPVSVVAKEGLPCLRRSISPRYHVLRDCRLGDVEAELQKLAVDMRRTPEWVLEAHSSDKVAHLFVDLRSATAGLLYSSLRIDVPYRPGRGTLAQEQGRSNQRKRKSASRDEPMVYWFQAPTNA
jgi:hypothetical protein